MTNTKQEAANEMEKRTRARQIDWAVYKFRSHFNLYELACLVHRLDPEAVNDDALYCFQIYEKEVWRATALQGGNALTNAMWERPARFFLPPVGDTLERMKKAAGSALGLSISVMRARDLIQSLGLVWPAELELKTTESQVKPAQSASAPPHEPPPAPATTAPAESVQAAPADAPCPLTTSDIAYCFAGLRWDEQGWKKPLGDKPKWLQSCIAIPGKRGVHETRWNPVLIGAALVQDGHAKPNSVRARFQSKPQLSPWLEAWKTYEADYLDTE